MTHAEALADSPGEWPGRGCPGALAPVLEEEDRVVRGGIRGTVRIRVYRCPRCRHILAIEDGGAVRNCYPEPEVPGR